jgi:hypothetical protein
MPELQVVAVRLLAAHATSAATERNWSLWGRMYCSVRIALGMDMEKALIGICAAERAKPDPTEEFEITWVFWKETQTCSREPAGHPYCPTFV